MVDLGPQHFISVVELTERFLGALGHEEPFGLTRWADSSNEIMRWWGKQITDPQYVVHPTGPVVHRYRGGVLTHAYYEDYAPVFLHGVQTCDVLGVFCNDVWVKKMMETLPLDITGKPLVYAWANKFLFVRRAVVEDVLEQPWQTALIGNRMPEFKFWLAEHFPKLAIVQCGTATDWPDVASAIEEFKETRPQLALVSAGWFTSCLVGAARDLGAVALSCGHLPDWWMSDPPMFPPNTEFPRGPQGMLDHCDACFEALAAATPQWSPAFAAWAMAERAEVVRGAEEMTAAHRKSTGGGT